MILDQAYAEDASANLTFSQARNLALTPFTGRLLKGYTASAIWVRVRIAKPSGTPEAFLYVGPQVLDEVALFDPSRPHAPPLMNGDRHPKHDVESGMAGNLFALNFDGPQKEYWLRIRTTSTMAPSLRVFSHASLHLQSQTINQFQNIYTGMTIAFVMWSAGMFATRRGDRIIFTFLSLQLMGLSAAFSYLGYFRLWFSHWSGAALFDGTSSFLIAATTSCSHWFHHEFLKTCKPDDRLLRVLLFLRLTSLPVFFMLLAGEARMALQLNMAMMATAPFLMLAIAATAGHGRPRQTELVVPRNTMVLFYTVLLLVSGNNGFLRLGMPLSSIFADHRIVMLFNAIMVISLLQWRALRMDRMKLRVAHRSRQLRQKRIHKRQKLDEQDQFMSMLSHELKTPLSVLRLATAMSLRSAPLQQHAERAILDITTIIDRCAALFEMEQSASAPVAVSIDMEHELRELCARKNAAHIVIFAPAKFAFATDRGLFRILAGNLMDNALKYGDPTSPIHIHILPRQHRRQQGVLLEFSNAPGPGGFPDPAKLFEKFYRAPAARRERGAGLGLHIVQGVSRKLGGTIEYKPSPQRIRFKLWLPHLA